jgi:hypothetical protein
MGQMIKDLDAVKAGIEGRVLGLKSSFEKVGLSTKSITTLAGVASWVGGELPMLNRRQTMAEELSKENGQFGFGSGMMQTEWAGLFKSKAEAEAKAKELAAKYQKPGGFPDEVWDEIRKYQSDPDFAAAFLQELGPEKAAWIAGRLRTWDEPGHEARLQAFGNLMAVASQQGVITDQWLAKFATDGRDGPDLYTLAAVIKYGVWDKDTLVNIGKRALSGDQAAGGNYLTADILDGIARNPLAAHELYSQEFDRINSMAYGKAFGWVQNDDPKLGDPLGRFIKAATIDAAEAFERTRPPGDQNWVNPADELALRLIETVGRNPGERFPFSGVENAFTDVVQQFFKGAYTEDLLPEGTLSWADAVGLAADVVGIFDPTPISDGVSGLISLGQGDWKGALLSAVAMVPYFGDAGAKPIKTMLRLLKNFPGLRIFFKVPDDVLADEGKLAKYVDAIKQGFEDLRSTFKNVDLHNPTKILDALGIVNRLHVDAEKAYARFPRWRARAESLGLPTDGPVPFVPPRNWDPSKVDSRSITDAYGNVWQRGPRHGRGTNDSPYEWDVQVSNARSGLGTLTHDGAHLNVEWGTGRVAN